MKPYINKIHLDNKFKLIESSFLINLYKLYPNLIFKYFIFKLKLFRISIYPIFLLSNLLGMKKLSQHKYNLLQAEYLDIPSLKFTIRDTNSQFHSIYFDRFKSCYEPDVSATLEIFLTEKSILLDIGSNWGHHSFSAALKKKCSVIAFEPNQEVYRDFVRINKQLGLVDKVKIHNCALSSVDSSLLLSQNYFDSGVASISQSYSESVLTSHKSLNFLQRIFGVSTVEEVVKVKTLDSFKIESATLIKIDAEGVELEILKGAKETIKSLRPIIIFEFFNGIDASINNFFDFFANLNYVIYQVICTKDVEDTVYTFILKKLVYENLVANNQYNLLAISSEFSLE